MKSQNSAAFQGSMGQKKMKNRRRNVEKRPPQNETLDNVLAGTLTFFPGGAGPKPKNA